MKVLVADDDGVTRLALTKVLEKSGYEVVAFDNGLEAFNVLTGEAPPRIAILDWLMPGMEGVEICRKLHKRNDLPLIYTILLTIKKEKTDISNALDYGAYDFVAKPVHAGELRSRIAVGHRLVEAENRMLKYITEIERKNTELEHAMAMIKKLSGMLPICSSCKKIRDDEGYWNQIEVYIEKHSEALFSHSLCPDCMEKSYGRQEWYQKKYKKKE